MIDTSTSQGRVDLMVVRSSQHTEWNDLRAALPIGLDEAHLILESDSEMRAEFGSGYVCGGGHPHDAGLAYDSFGLDEAAHDVLDRARERVSLSLPWPVREFFPAGFRPDSDPDLPF